MEETWLAGLWTLRILPDHLWNFLVIIMLNKIILPMCKCTLPPIIASSSLKKVFTKSFFVILLKELCVTFVLVLIFNLIKFLFLLTNCMPVNILLKFLSLCSRLIFIFLNNLCFPHLVTIFPLSLLYWFWNLKLSFTLVRVFYRASQNLRFTFLLVIFVFEVIKFSLANFLRSSWELILVNRDFFFVVCHFPSFQLIKLGQP